MPARSPSSHYDVLQLRSDASADEIRAAWRRLAQQHHPDRAGAVADAQAITHINRAYEVLSNPHARAQHDFELRGHPGLRPRTLRQQRRRQARAWTLAGAALVVLAGVSWGLVQIWRAPEPRAMAPVMQIDPAPDAPLRLVPARQLSSIPRQAPDSTP